MATTNLNDTAYFGTTSRPGVGTSIDFSCKRCGSNLAGRRETRRRSVVRGVQYAVDIYRCGCGRGRHIRRPVKGRS